MELVTLSSDTLQPDALVENYESLIWSERYNKAGDFVLVTDNIVETMNALPLDSFVSLRETTVPMQVETHQIKKNQAKVSQLTVTGRSCEACILELRASVRDKMDGSLTYSPNSRPPWYINAAKESDAAYEMLRIVLGDPLAQYVNGSMALPALSPASSPNDAIPQVSLTMPADYRVVLWNSTTKFYKGDVVYQPGKNYISLQDNNVNHDPSLDDTHVWWDIFATDITLPVDDPSPAPFLYEIAPNDLYSKMLELININFRGVKAVRPSSGNQFAFEIYNGRDLRDILVFSAKTDDLDNANYLLSKQPARNVGYVYGSTGAGQVLKNAGPEPSGLQRRVMVLDQASETALGTADARRSRGLIELYKNNEVTLFDGELAYYISDLYNKANGYMLGDIIRLVGEYGMERNVRVTEFIRTSDANGYKAYPTLEAVDS